MFSEKFEETSNLSYAFNQAQKKLHLKRMIIAPSNTQSNGFNVNDEIIKEFALGFYYHAMFDVYCSSVIEHLTKWKKDAEEYISEFNCSWKFYALSRKLKSIKEYGADEDDYDKNGNIKESFTDEELKSWSIVEGWRGYNDIIFFTNQDDLNMIYNTISTDAIFTIEKMFEDFGTPVKTYHQNEQGEMIENTFADNVIN